MHEKFAGRLYKPREQLLRFIEGLDTSFAPAISRIRIQLDNWNTETVQPPENLQLANLPNLIEQYMEDNGATDAVIRRFIQRPKPYPARITQDTNKEEANNDKHPYVDIKYPLCLTFGHPKQHCIVWPFG
jgi:hypothetical protein